MKEYKTTAHINSLKGEMAEIIILEKVGDNVTLFLIGSYANITPTIFTGELNNEIHFLSLQRIRNVRFRLLRRRNARIAILRFLYAKTGCKQIQT